MSISQNLPNLAIGYSLARLFKLLGASLLATLLCGALAFSWHYGKDIATIQIALSYFGIVFFGLTTCKTLSTLISAREPVLFPRGSVKIPRVWSLETPPPDDRRQRR
ncbi:hypothetical protein ABIF50_008669 [Bradyrhizobium diazoefficiens]